MFIYARLYIFWDLRYTTVLVSKTQILLDFFHSISYSSYFFFLSLECILAFLFDSSVIFSFCVRTICDTFFYHILLWFFIITYSTSTSWNTSACRNNFAEIPVFGPDSSRWVQCYSKWGRFNQRGVFPHFYGHRSVSFSTESLCFAYRISMRKKILNAKPF